MKALYIYVYTKYNEGIVFDHIIYLNSLGVLLSLLEAFGMMDRMNRMNRMKYVQEYESQKRKKVVYDT